MERARFFLRFPFKILVNSWLVNHTLIDATYSFICNTHYDYDYERAERARRFFFCVFLLKILVNSWLVNHILIDATYSFICNTQNNHDLNHETRSLTIFINYYKRAERSSEDKFRFFRQKHSILVNSLMVNHLFIDTTCYSIRNTRNKIWP